MSLGFGICFWDLIVGLCVVMVSRNRFFGLVGNEMRGLWEGWSWFLGRFRFY